MKLGQWDTNTIYNVDALELLKGLPDGGVDAIITDPPYGIRDERIKIKHPSTGGAYKRVNEAWDDEVPLEWLIEAERCVRVGGSVISFGSWRTIDAVKYTAEARGWKTVNRIIWEKPDAPPNFSGRMLTDTTETAYWFCPSGSNWTYNRLEAKHLNTGANFRDVWRFGQTREQRHHPTQKPLALMERCILLFTNTGDVVVDPFAGSGTTGAAAVKHGRTFIGCDISREYVDIANARIALPFDTPMFAEATP